MPPRLNDQKRWECQFWTPPNRLGLKRRMYVVCPDGRNTKAFCKELVAQAIDRHVRGISNPNLTFRAFTEERFFPEYPAARNLRPSSRGVLEYLLQKVAFPALGELPLVTVDAAAVARLCAQLAAETREDGKPRYSAQTLRLTTIAVKGVLGWAKRTGTIESVPPIVIPKVPEAARPQPYSREEAQKLIAATTSDDERALCLLAFDAGLRKSEILGLTFGQIDFVRGVMLIDRQRYRGQLRQTKEIGRAHV